MEGLTKGWGKKWEGRKKGERDKKGLTACSRGK